MKGAEALLRTLLAGGVEVCFTNPGTSEMQFVTAVDRVEGMRAVLTLFEGVATGAADGYARMADKPACTLLHLGPGLGNGLTNLHNAMKAGTPVVNIVGEHAVSHLQYDAPLTADIAAYAKTVSGWIHTVASADTIAEDTARAIAAACEPPGRIATLIVPGDATWTDTRAHAVPPAPVPPRHVEETRITAAVRALASGEPAMLFLDGQALREPALTLAGRIAARCGARLMCPTFFPRVERGAGRVPVERLPYFPEPAIEAMAGTRHMIMVGAKPPVSFFAYPGVPSWLSPEQAAIHTLCERGEDAANALERLAERVGASGEPARLQPGGRPELPSGPLDAQKVAQAAGALLPEGAVVVDESITCGLPLYALTAAAPPHDWLLLTGGAIGEGMPLATGAAIAAPGRKVINFEADGSAAYTMQSLWTQARERLDVTTVIYANRLYKILQVEIQRTGAGNAGPRASSLLSIGQPDLDWVKLAQGMGVEAARATTAEEFNRLFADFVGRPGPNLIEAVVP